VESHRFAEQSGPDQVAGVETFGIAIEKVCDLRLGRHDVKLTGPCQCGGGIATRVFDLFRLDDKVVIVTGASSDLGVSFA
jgi:hypothetical protein